MDKFEKSPLSFLYPAIIEEGSIQVFDIDQEYTQFSPQFTAPHVINYGKIALSNGTNKGCTISTIRDDLRYLLADGPEGTLYLWHLPSIMTQIKSARK